MALVDATLRRQYRTEKRLRTSIEPVWDDIDYYTGPVKDSGSTAANPGGGTGANLEAKKDLWDHTAIDGREKLSASLHGSAVNPAVRFFSLAFRLALLNKDTEVKGWIDEEGENVWGDIADSDFFTEIGSFLHELAGPGHAFISKEMMPTQLDAKTLKEEWQGLDFTHIPLRQAYFQQDHKGGIKRFWNRNTWQASQVIDFCEEKKIPIPEDIQKASDGGDSTPYEIVFCIYERSKFRRKKVQYPAPPDRRPWGFVWWREDTGELLMKEGEPEGGYYEMPIHHCRWAKTGGSKWGHGPGNMALPTVKFVNGWKELIRAAAEKDVDPPWITTKRNLLSDVDFRPAGVTIVADIEKMKALIGQGRFDIAEGMLKEDQAMIRRIFHTDELELKDSPAMTATEAQIRYEWMNRLLGKMLTNLQSMLSAIILDILTMKARIGAMEIPAKVKKAGGIFNVEYQGPLARSQRTDEVAAIERGAGFIAGLAQVWPEARACFNPYKAIKQHLIRLGVPAELIPSESEAQKGMEDIRKQMSDAASAKANKDQASANKSHADAMAAAPSNGGNYPIPPSPPMSLGGRTVGAVSALR